MRNCDVCNDTFTPTKIGQPTCPHCFYVEETEDICAEYIEEVDVLERELNRKERDVDMEVCRLENLANSLLDTSVRLNRKSIIANLESISEALANIGM